MKLSISIQKCLCDKVTTYLKTKGLVGKRGPPPTLPDFEPSPVILRTHALLLYGCKASLSQ
eukprot:6156412-Prorocentrum_lima.AAC.1